ncbi:MAG: hypothetical protein H0W83_02315 [Planctomycetes bacterium]|nr:hypothetical protein [Planctomycetota bacterium]
MQFHPALNMTVLLAVAASARGEVCNLRVVTDANPDYTDMPGLVHSIASRWEKPSEKCWALFYWNHIARRQTQPMMLHGLALTDPIRQFNDYGFTMCSTISGINQSIWEQMGLKHQYWDISNHTVSQVFYDDAWHLYDNSLSAIYTLCDGKTLASIPDIGKEGGCAASGGRIEPGHIARYHCLSGTSPNGFLIGADCIRPLTEEQGCFNPKGLKFRSYYYDWDNGHRYILNLKDGETYTRFYHSLGTEAAFYVPNHGRDPESENPRYRIRGNGTWHFTPPLAADYRKAIHSDHDIGSAAGGLQPANAGTPGEVIYKIQSANVSTHQRIDAVFSCKTASDVACIAISTTNGLQWQEVWKNSGAGEATAHIEVPQVNGSYETLIRIGLTAHEAPADAVMTSLNIETTTEVNSKTQPRLNLGKNQVHVGAGDQTESIVFWPELQASRAKNYLADEKNVTSVPEHAGYLGVIHPTAADQDAWQTYRIDAPADITRVTYGGRFYNRVAKSHIDLRYSTDGGKTWTQSWTITDIAQPYDVIHYETVTIPAGVRSVLLKYVMNSPAAAPSACSIYAVRMEADHAPVDASFRPMEVSFEWSEVQKDRSLKKRHHTQLVEKIPATYTIDVGGDDHPVMESMSVGLVGAHPASYGYSDGTDVRGEKFVGSWVTYGANLAVGKSYSVSVPSETNWEAGDPNGKKLTDGVVGPPYSGGVSYQTGALWSAGKNPVITVDLGAATACASFGLNIHGYEPKDALKGEVADVIEVLVSDNGTDFTSAGFLRTDMRWKDLPVNHMWTDEETMCGFTARLIPPKPVSAHFVRFRTETKRFLCVTEIEVLDAIEFKPFDLRVALPDK